MAKLIDTVAIQPDNPWTRAVSDVLRQVDISKWFRAEFRTSYPRNQMPAATSHVFPFEQDPYRLEDNALAVGPAPGNPDHEQSVAQGFATCNTDTGVITCVAHDLNGRSIESAGPAIVFDTVQATYVDMSCQAALDYVYRFEAAVNPQFDPAHVLGPAYEVFMEFAVEIRAYLSVTDKTTGVGYGSTAGHGASRPYAIRMYPGGIPGSLIGTPVVAGTYRNDSDVSVPVKFNSTFTVPGNSRCTVELVCLTDTTASGPRNGKWNRHVCYAESTTTLVTPKIELTLFRV